MTTQTQPAPVLAWHRQAAKEINKALLRQNPTVSAIIARHDEGRTDSPALRLEKNKHAETLRLLREADEVLCDVSRYPVASAYPDGPCLERETHDNVCKLLIAIRAHLAAQS